MKQVSIGKFLTILTASIAVSFSPSAMAEGNKTQPTSADTATTRWLEAMSPKLAASMPEPKVRLEFLNIVFDESKRVGIDSQLVLALIDKVSQFRKYAIAESGSRGYMQVHPKIPSDLGPPSDNLFATRTNIRYGCVLFRTLLDEHKGDHSRALTTYEQQIAGRFDAPAIKPNKFARDVMTLMREKWSYSASALQ